MGGLAYTPATELASLVRTKAISPVETAKDTHARIEAVNPTLNCFCFVHGDEELAEARASRRAAFGA